MILPRSIPGIKTRKRVSVIRTVALCLFTLSATVANAGSGTESIKVKVAKVQQKSISEFEFGQGTIKSTRREYLVFQSSGRVDFVKSGAKGGALLEGDKVKAGELLAELGHRRNNASLVTAKANLRKARAELRKAKGDYERAERLKAGGAIAGSRFDQLKTIYEQALTSVQVAEANLDETQAGLSESQLRSPFDGQVAFINVHEGQYYSQQQFDPATTESATLTAPLVIIDPTSFEIIVDMPVFSGNRVEVGQNAYLLGQESMASLQKMLSTSIDSLNQYLTPAKVLSVSPALNPKDRSVRIRLSTGNATSDSLIDGDFVTALLEVGSKKNATVVPLNALVAKGSKFYVYVVDEKGRAEKREVTVGLFGFNTLEVLSGLELGELVVTKGKTRLKHGSVLTIVNESSQMVEGEAVNE